MASSSKSPAHPTPSPNSFPETFPYDVFLSFRGIDTRNNFIGHLYDRLVMAGIRTFMDDPDLRIGGEISLQLMRAIKKSRIYIVVFSVNYASSRWCLDELVKIMEFEGRSGRVAIPVFYHVKPHEVRYQSGSFEEALRQHESRYYYYKSDMVKGWRDALYRATHLSGFDLENNAIGSESRLISLIVEEVLAQVKPKKMFVANHPVGLSSRLLDLDSLISFKSNVCLMVGIWGMGGLGKTAIAKALYNAIHQRFDLSCFLANVREVSEQPNGLVYLQEQLISELLSGKQVKVRNVDEGISFISERFNPKKVLIVLDDLDKLSQVNALAGNRDWFGAGSVIIITTRDLHLLNQLHVDAIYEVKELNNKESLELFSWHSFQKASPQEPFGVIADKIVTYSCGLPLALEVLGSYLCRRTVQEWESTFEMLQKIPLDEIQQILKISYDGLTNDEQRDIFLDIACFFIGANIDHVTDILNGCGFSTEIGIRILIDKCLLTVNKKNELRMHDLIRDMGKEVIRKEFPKELGKRSRLWTHEDVTKVLKRNMGTEAIEGFTLVSPEEVEIHLKTVNFERMHNLRLLQMEKVNLEGSFEHLSGKLRWIRWQECSLSHLPSDLQVTRLVTLDMQHSRMTRVWEQLQFPHLKILNISHSKRLTSTPDFRSVPNIVTLILVGCTSLVEIDPSIGCLGSLLILNMEGCEKITNIPSEICRLRLLGYLNLSGCSNLKELPDDLGDIEFLSELYADETAIAKLPVTIGGYHQNLRSLSLRGCTKISIKASMTSDGLPLWRSNNLRRLNLRDCNMSDEDIHVVCGWHFRELRALDLAGNRLTILPHSFEWLTNLESLWLDDWNMLQSFPNLPPNLETLLALHIG